MTQSNKQTTLQATWDRLLSSTPTNLPKNVQDTSSLLAPAEDHHSQPPHPLEEDTSLSPSASKKPRSSKSRPKSPAPAAKETFILEDSEDSEEEDPEGWGEVKRSKSIKIPLPDPTLILSSIIPIQVISSRFNMVIKHPLPCSLPDQMSQTMKTLTQFLKAVQEDSVWQGYPVLVPWQDEVVYKNRILPKFIYGDFHENKKLTRLKDAKYFLSTYLNKWSALQKKTSVKSDGDGIKYFQIQIAWIFDTPLLGYPLPSLWSDLVSSSSEDFDGFSLRKCATQAIDPIVVIQFLHSAVHPSEQWDSHGHPDCYIELHSMLKRIVGDSVEIGLVSKRFDNGKYSEKNPMVCMVECDRKHADVVQKDLVRAFSRMDSSDPLHSSKQARIHNGIYTNWIATPTFSSLFKKSDVAQLAHYNELMIKEKEYRLSINSIKIEGVRINHLDHPAPLEAHLSPHMLLQLENKNLEFGDTPIRHLIFDAKYKERHLSMIQSYIDRENPGKTWDEKSLSKEISRVKGLITWEMVLSSLSDDGILSPMTSLPTPRPSQLSLRKKLLSLKSRSFPGEPVLVYESVTVTDDGSLLLIYSNRVAEEALNIAKLLPLFIQHEMHVDPIFYCMPSLMNMAIDGYFNPLTRTGHIGLLQNTASYQNTHSKKTALPEFCRAFSSEELIKVLKCPLVSGNTYHNLHDDDLQSLADTIVTSPDPMPLLEHSMNALDLLLQENRIINANADSDNVSAMSNSTFDSRTSYNAFQIDSRAQLLAQHSTVQRMESLANRARLGDFSSSVRDMACEFGGFSPADFLRHFPQEYHILWPDHDGGATHLSDADEAIQESNPDGYGAFAPNESGAVHPSGEEEEIMEDEERVANHSDEEEEIMDSNPTTNANEDLEDFNTTFEDPNDDDISSIATDKMASPNRYILNSIDHDPDHDHSHQDDSSKKSEASRKSDSSKKRTAKKKSQHLKPAKPPSLKASGGQNPAQKI